MESNPLSKSNESSFNRLALLDLDSPALLLLLLLCTPETLAFGSSVSASTRLRRVLQKRLSEAGLNRGDEEAIKLVGSC